MAEVRLRVGILCDDLRFQRWQAACIRAVHAVPGVELAVVVVNASATSAEQPSIQRILRHPWRTALYRLYRQRWFRPGAMAAEDLPTLLAGVPVMRCVPEVRGHSTYIPAKDLDALRAQAPDVLLRFGFGILRGPVLELPRYGVWSYHHGDEEYYRGGPPGFWELMDGDPLTGAILQRLTERLDGGRILRKGWFRTIDHSLAETVDTVLMHSAGWAAQVCRELLLGRTAAADGIASTTEAPIHRYPRNATFLRFLWKQARNKVRFHRAELSLHEEWNIGVLPRPIHTLLEERPSLNVRWLPAPAAGQFRADPFGYMADDQLNVLYEKYDHGTHLGEISRLRPKRDNVLKRSRTMLAGDGHLSYPYIVERDGQVFVVPESAAAGRVDLYRLHAANDGLERVCTLLEEPLFDPTLFEHEGRWWLFGTKAPLTNVELFAYHAERFEGPYVPHVLNPVKADIRSARPGGTPFRTEEGLWRPAQDSSLTYGGRIALNRVLELSPTAFREETVKYIGPLKGSAWSKGLHTISAVGDLTLVDGKRFVTDKAQQRRVRQRKMERLSRKRPSAPDLDEADDDA